MTAARAEPLVVGVAALAAVLGFLAGRHTSPSAGAVAMPSAPSSAPSAAPALLPVPFVRQSTEYSCGAAAVSGLLSYWAPNLELREADLQKLLHTNDDVGTDPVNMVKMLGRLQVDGGAPPPLTADGRQPNDGTVVTEENGATVVRLAPAEINATLLDVELRYRVDEAGARAAFDADVDRLREASARRDTVLLDMQAWREREDIDWSTDWADGHWVVLVGVDAENVYVMDPYAVGGYAFVRRAELAARWHGEGTGHTKWHHIAVFVHGKEGSKPLASLTPLQRMP